MQKVVSLQDIKLAKAFAEMMAKAGLITKGTKAQYAEKLKEAK